MNKKSIELYSLATPNGQKISVALEEMGLEYEGHTINILTGDQFTNEFIKINPNSKIPAIVDYDGPNGKRINIMESGAILLYLAEKTGQFLPTDPMLKQQTVQWLFFQVAGIGPMFGQFGHFYKYAKEKCTAPYPLERYTTETLRLLAVLDKQLEGQDYLIGDQYTIADIATFPWVKCLDVFYGAQEQLKLSEYINVTNWLERCLQRPAVQKGMNICPFPS